MKIKYKDVIDLGFKRQDQSDENWFDEFGYEWFLVTLKLSKKIYLEWDCESHEVALVRINRDKDILAQWPMPDIATIKKVIEMFGKIEPIKPVTYNPYTVA